MKSRSRPVLFAAIVMLLSATIGCGLKDNESIELKRLKLFLADEHIPTEQQDYMLIVQPGICVSCVGYYMHTISSKIPKGKKLLVICHEQKQKEVAAYIDHANTEYCSDFDDENLRREPFLASGIGYAKLHDGRLIDVVPVNKSLLQQLLAGIN